MTRFWKVFVWVWPLVLVAVVRSSLSKEPVPSAPIAVIDRDAIVFALADRQGTDAAILGADAIADRLAAEGFVVLDRRYVLRAPADSLVKP